MALTWRVCFVPLVYVCQSRQEDLVSSSMSDPFVSGMAELCVDYIALASATYYGSRERSSKQERSRALPSASTRSTPPTSSSPSRPLSNRSTTQQVVTQGRQLGIPAIVRPSVRTSSSSSSTYLPPPPATNYQLRAMQLYQSSFMIHGVFLGLKRSRSAATGLFGTGSLVISRPFFLCA